MTDELERLLDEQSTYYRDRAPEYDLWWRREGMYDGGEDFNRSWHAEIDELRGVLARFGPRGDVLELAAGTGGWTVELAPHADRITAVDQSPEALAINREKLAGTAADITYVEADLFEWRPDRRYDVVFFSFWLSHVPPSRFDGFWDMVGEVLAPGGRVFLIDNLQPPSTPVERPGVSLRRLSDGREYRIVKVYWTAEELRARLAQRGWRIDGGRTERFFTYAWGSRG